MSTQEMTTYDAQAIDEVEASVAKAEETTKEALCAEAYANVVEAFAEASMETLKGRNAFKEDASHIFLHL